MNQPSSSSTAPPSPRNTTAALQERSLEENLQRCEDRVVLLTGLLQASGTAMLLGAVVGAIAAADLHPLAVTPQQAAGVSTTAFLIGLFARHGTHHLTARRWAISVAGLIALTICAGGMALYTRETSTATALAWTVVALGSLLLVAPSLVAVELAEVSQARPVIAPSRRALLAILGVASLVPLPVVWSIAAHAAMAERLAQ